MKNVKESMYNTERCYIYNKAFARYFDNNNAYSELDLVDQYDGKTTAGALSSDCDTHDRQLNIQEAIDGCGPDCECMNPTHFDLIREWADERGLYNAGDPKTQALKLVEELGETCRAILKKDEKEVIDGIGDCVVVLTNLAELVGTPIEDCIEIAYNEIKDRKGKMDNGTFKKD